MTKIVEGRMIIKRINIRIPPMKGEVIVREPEPRPEPEPPPEKGHL